MKELKFPLLTKDDIELRIGQISKDGTKASLLLYQDARCGMKYLDMVLGPTNWQKKYYEVRGLVICSLGININFDEPNKEPYWVWKDDTGTAGSIEEEKSIISDSFKRSLVCLGLARELYTAPDIWVKIESKYDKFKVKEIGYNENREIVSLVITDKNNQVAYSYGKNASKPTQAQKEPKKVVVEDRVSQEDKEIVGKYMKSIPLEKMDQFEIWLFRFLGKSKIEQLTSEEFHKLAMKVKGE